MWILQCHVASSSLLRVNPFLYAEGQRKLCLFVYVFLTLIAIQLAFMYVSHPCSFVEIHSSFTVQFHSYA